MQPVGSKQNAARANVQISVQRCERTVYSGSRTQAPTLSKTRVECSRFLGVGGRRGYRNPSLLGPSGHLFGTPGVILVAFWRPGHPLGTILGTWAAGSQNGAFVDPLQGPFGVHFGHQNAKGSRKTLKSWYLEAVLRKDTLLTGSGETPNVIRSIKTICFVRSAGTLWDHFGRPLGSLLRPFWALCGLWTALGAPKTGSRRSFEKQRILGSVLGASQGGPVQAGIAGKWVSAPKISKNQPTSRPTNAPSAWRHGGG